MKGSEFIFDSAQLMHCKYYRVNFRHGGSNIDSPDLKKEKKKATINPKNQDDKRFQYAATIALNYEETESHPERFSDIKRFLNKYKWEGIYYFSKINDWKSNEISNHWLQMIGWHYRAVKTLSPLLTGLTINKNTWAYTLWIFNVKKLSIWLHKKQT